VSLEGTPRSFSEPVRHRLHRRLEEVCEGVAHAMGGEAEVRIFPGPPLLANDPEVTERFARTAARVAGEGRVTVLDRPGMVSEDFAFYLKTCPGTFFPLADCDATQDHAFPHHHPRFALDEDPLPLAPGDGPPGGGVGLGNGGLSLDPVSRRSPVQVLS